jgi:hypothetical protein
MGTHENTTKHREYSCQYRSTNRAQRAWPLMPPSLRLRDQSPHPSKLQLEVRKDNGLSRHSGPQMLLLRTIAYKFSFACPTSTHSQDLSRLESVSISRQTTHMICRACWPCKFHIFTSPIQAAPFCMTAPAGYPSKCNGFSIKAQDRLQY